MGIVEKFQKILTGSFKCDKIIKILGLKGVKNMSKTVTRKREFYEKPSVKRKRKSEAARKRKKF